jgi:peptidoglycan/LPS O-acetylase OafA/YrhL
MAIYVPDILFFISAFIFSKKAFAYAVTVDNFHSNILKLFKSKFVRIYPLYIAAILIFWTITPTIHAGPIWYVYQTETAVCNSAWWRVFMLIDNWFVNGCYDWAWFVPV